MDDIAKTERLSVPGADPEISSENPETEDTYPKTERLPFPGSNSEILPDNSATEGTDPKTERLPVPGNPETTVDRHFTGSLKKGEIINGYTVGELLSAHTGEAEIFFAEKDATKAVVKYYHGIIKPVKEILQKLKNIKHPDIIQLYDYGTYNGRYFEIMEFAAGGTLGDKNPDGSYRYLPLSEQQIIQILKETSESLTFIHQRGIIHRDIKPGNLFYRNSNGSDVMLGDFGISSLLDMDQGQSNRVTTKIALSEGYAAPELYGIARDGGEAKILIGPEVDYYALGMTVFELLTGMSPFQNKNPLIIMRDTIEGRVINDLLSMPVAQNFSPRINTLLRGLLTVKHDKRWGYEELRQWLVGGEVEVFQEESPSNSRNTISGDSDERVEESDIPTLKFGDFTINSVSQFIMAIDAEKELALKYLKRGFFDRWAIKFDESLANTIIDAKELDLAGNQPVSYLLLRIDPGRATKDKNPFSIQNINDLRRFIRNKPEAMKAELYGKKNSDLIPRLLIHFPDLAAIFASASMKLEKIQNKESRETDFIISELYLSISKDSIQPIPNDPLEIRNIEELLGIPDHLQLEILKQLENTNSILYLWLSRHRNLHFAEVWENATFSWDTLVSIIKGDLIKREGKWITFEKNNKILSNEFQEIISQQRIPIQQQLPLFFLLYTLYVILSFPFFFGSFAALTQVRGVETILVIRNIVFIITFGIFRYLEFIRFWKFKSTESFGSVSDTEEVAKRTSVYLAMTYTTDLFLGLFIHTYLLYIFIIPIFILINRFYEKSKNALLGDIRILFFYKLYASILASTSTPRNRFFQNLVEYLEIEIIEKFQWNPDHQIQIPIQLPSGEQISLFSKQLMTDNFIFDRSALTFSNDIEPIKTLAFTSEELLLFKTDNSLEWFSYNDFDSIESIESSNSKDSKYKFAINGKTFLLSKPISSTLIELLRSIQKIKKSEQG